MFDLMASSKSFYRVSCRLNVSLQWWPIMGCGLWSKVLENKYMNDICVYIYIYIDVCVCIYIYMFIHICVCETL